MTLLDDMASDISGSHVFYDTDSGFAVDATTTGGTIQVIFDNDFIALDEGVFSVNGTQPRAWCRTSEAPARDATLVINSVTYVVYNNEINSDGETLLQLVEQT